jgi:dimethylglycine dehydrogenase
MFSHGVDRLILTMLAMRQRLSETQVGLGDISGFAKYEVSGSGAAAWLDQLLAAAIPPIGRMTLAPMLKDDGKIIGDFSLARLGDTRFLIIGSGIAESYHMRWFLSHLPDDGSVHGQKPWP